MLGTLALFGLSNQDIATASPCRDAYGDFNGDGHRDEINTCSSGSYFYFSNADGSLSLVEKRTDLTLGPGFPYWNERHKDTRITSGDFNGDGMDDIIISNPWGHFWEFSNGDGTWKKDVFYLPPFHLPKLTEKFVIGDYNGDGMDDFVIRAGQGSYWYYSLGDGTWRIPHYRSDLHLGEVKSCTPQDLNNDGFTDLVFETKSGSFNYYSNGYGNWSYGTLDEQCVSDCDADCFHWTYSNCVDECEGGYIDPNIPPGECVELYCSEARIMAAEDYTSCRDKCEQGFKCRR